LPVTSNGTLEVIWPVLVLTAVRNCLNPASDTMAELPPGLRIMRTGMPPTGVVCPIGGCVMLRPVTSRRVAVPRRGVTRASAAAWRADRRPAVATRMPPAWRRLRQTAGIGDLAPAFLLAWAGGCE